MAATKYAAYYSVTCTQPNLCVVHDKDIVTSALCCGCAPAFRAGARWGDSLILTMTRVKAEDAPFPDAVVCEQCAEEIVTRGCERCGARAEDCGCA